MGDDHMGKGKKLLYRICGFAMILLGLILAVTWNRAGFNIGDRIFTFLGLPAWSKGTGGLHYSAVIGSLAALCGIGMTNLTLQKKFRIWVWGIILLFLVVLNLVSSYS